MRRIIISLVVLLAFSVTGAYAGAGHSHAPKTKLTKTDVLSKATSIVAEIVEKGKLDASWAELKPVLAEKKTFKNRSEWVITFNNPSEKDLATQKLYVFLSLYGDYLGANHTGS